MSRARRTFSALTGAVALAVLLSVGSAPAGAVNGDWTLTIDDHPDVLASRPVEVTGQVKRLGGLLDGLIPVRSVTVTLVPTGEAGLPQACRGDALRQTVTPSQQRYRATLTPPCNGPYRIEVTATSDLGGSGSPRTEDVALADPGPAPAAPRAVGTTNGAIVSWAAASSPDVVGWTVTGGLAPASYDASTTQATVPASPGGRQIGLVARRWGAQGPGGPEVASPSSAVAAVTVTAPQTSVPNEPPPATTPPSDGPPRSTGGSGANLPSRGGATAPSRSSGVTVPARRPPTGTPEGYSEDLPYGAPDDAFRPGDDPAADAGSADDGAGDERAGTSPSASLVRTRDETSPGLVAPFALAILMATIATHIAWYLRRSRALVPA